jgi:hypothetical protein
VSEKGGPLVVRVVGLTDEDRADLARLPDAGRYRFLPLGGYDDATDPQRCEPRRFIAEAVAAIRADKDPTHGVIGVDDYPPSLLVPAIAAALGLPGNSLPAVLRCEHKYWSRLEQRQAAPDAVPAFRLVPLDRDQPPDLAFPFWLKPVKSFLSYLGFRVADRAQFAQALATARRQLPPFVRAFDEMLDGVPPPEGGSGVSGLHMMAETLLGGRQCTLEGFVHRGRTQVLGIVDSIRFPNRVSFKRFVYPSALPRAAQSRMAEIARTLMARIGFDSSLFNIEFFVGADNMPKLIEVNSRFSPQFSDLFEKVDGTSTLQILVELATGQTPSWSPRQGRYRLAASCVLRSFEDRMVIRVPADADIARAAAAVPDTVVRIRATAGKRLSDWPQDSYSFRYALLNIGGRDERDLQARLARATQLLPFEFARP